MIRSALQPLFAVNSTRPPDGRADHIKRKDVRNRTRRQVVESMRLSWSAYKITGIAFRLSASAYFCHQYTGYYQSSSDWDSVRCWIYQYGKIELAAGPDAVHQTTA